jgi:general secretion pathway protein H
VEKAMPRDAKGFTFIELTVVLVLIGLVFTITMPRFRDQILSDTLKSTTRKMMYKIMDLRNEAISEHKAYFLVFDLESNRYWVEYEDITPEDLAHARENADAFPEGVRVLDIWFKGKGKEMTGETTIKFTRQGYVQQSVIHLGSEDGRKFTLVLSPFLGRVKVLEDYIEFEDI